MLNYLHSLLKILHHPLNRHQKISTLSRILAWKLFQKTFHQDVIAILENSSKMIIPSSSSYGSIIQYDRGRPDPVETMILLKILKKNDVFIDVGANIGYYSVLALGQGGKVYSFEPNVSLHSYLITSADLNGKKNNLILSSSIISDHQGYERFVFENESEISHIEQDRNNIHSKKIRSTTLDNIAKTFQLNKITLIKIDVEGAEPQVFEGMRNIIEKKRVSYILFEHDPNNNQNENYSQLIRKMSKRGKLFTIDHHSLRPFRWIDLNKKMNLFINFSDKNLDMSNFLFNNTNVHKRK